MPDTSTRADFDDALDLSALSQAHAVRERRVSSEELVRGYLARIVRHNPRLHAFVEVSSFRAVHWARAKDAAARRSRDLPPFHGVPIGVKDLNLVRGFHVRFGSRALPNMWSLVDDRTVRSLRRAGFVIIGKLATSEWGAMPVTEPDIHPPTRNPWNESFSAGGSSGGSAAAIAAGLLPIAQGSDGAGSIRIPAAFCNLFGVKPSRGRVLNPYFRDDPRLLYGCGPIARSVDDAAALLDALNNGQRPEQSFAAAARVEPRALRIKLQIDSPLSQTHPEHVRAAQDVARRLERAGHLVERCPALDLELSQFLPLWQRLIATAPVTRGRLQPITRWLLDNGRRLKARSVSAMHDRLVVEIDAMFGGADVLVSPTVAVPAPRIGAFQELAPERGFEAAALLGAFTAPFNITGQPAVSIPAGFRSDGMPMGVQLVGRRGCDGLILALARQLEPGVAATTRTFTPAATRSRSERL